MGTFAETAISTVYRSPTQEKKLVFHLKKKNVIFDFLLVLFCVNTYIYTYILKRQHTYIYTYIYIYIHIYIYAAVSDGKLKTEAQEIFLNPLTICS